MHVPENVCEKDTHNVNWVTVYKTLAETPVQGCQIEFPVSSFKTCFLPGNQT